jgi:hypothetical protein
VVKFAIVKASQLGNCWSAVRHTVGCQACDQYEKCQKPERVADAEYDARRAEAVRLRKQANELMSQARAMGHGQRRTGAGT